MKHMVCKSEGYFKKISSVLENTHNAPVRYSGLYEVLFHLDIDNL